MKKHNRIAAPVVEYKPEEIRAMVAKAPELRARLGAVTDELNQSLTAVEAALVSLDLGVSARVCFPDGEDWLVFNRYGDAWRLLVISDDNEEVKPLVNASRSRRLEGSALLQPLIEKLVEEGEKTLANVEKHVADAITFVETLKALK